MLCFLLSVCLLAPQDPVPAGAQTPTEIAARGAGLSVTVTEVEDLLVDRHALSSQGREALEVLFKSRLLEQLAQDAGVRVDDRDVTKRWNELDARAKAAGTAGGLLEVIEARGLTLDEFREFLRLAIVQERLTRRALDLDDDEPVTDAQQEIWLNQVIADRGLERPAPPWPDGVAAKSGDVVVDARSFASFLRERLPREDVQEACWHLLLLRGLEKRLPDLAPDARQRAVEDEVARRRAEHQSAFPTMTFEQRLGGLGRTVEQLERDPSVHIAALTRLWVDRKYDADALRDVYEDERAFFDGRYGRSAQAHLLFLVAGRFVNELVPRTFQEAERKLADMAERIGDVSDFEALALQFSEEPNTRKEKGALGRVTRALPETVPEEVRQAVFDHLDAGGKVPLGGVALGPIRMGTGVGLVWISDVRSGPGWEGMRENVHRELRRRLVVDLMPTGAMEILLFQ